MLSLRVEIPEAAEDNLVVALVGAVENDFEGKNAETSFFEQKQRVAKTRQKSLKNAACSVKNAKQQGLAKLVGHEEECSGCNSNEDSEHSNKLSQLFKWSKLGTSVDEDKSSAEDKKTGPRSPQSQIGPQIEMTINGSEETRLGVLVAQTDSVTLSRQSSSFEQKGITVRNESKHSDDFSPCTLLSNSSLGNILGSAGSESKTPKTLSPSGPVRPKILISDDNTPSALCALRQGSSSPLLLQAPIHSASPTSNCGPIVSAINASSSNHIKGTRRRNEDSMAVIFMAIILVRK